MIKVYCNTCENELKSVQPYVEESKPDRSGLVSFQQGGFVAASPDPKGLLNAGGFEILISGGEGHICRACLKAVL